MVQVLRKKVKPNPGSKAAIKLGCTCAVIDNHYGKGFELEGESEPQFWISGDCKVHASAAFIQNFKRFAKKRKKRNGSRAR